MACLSMKYMTLPEPTETLTMFYRRVRPQGPGWKPFAAMSGPVVVHGSLRRELANALLGCVLVYSALFGVGQILLRSAAIGLGLLLTSALAAVLIARNLEHLDGDSATRAAAAS